MTLSEHYIKIRDLIISNNLIEAKKILKENNLELTNNAEELNIIGSFYFKDKQYSKSKEIYKKILFNNENYVPALLNIGILEQQLNNFTSAFNYFEKSLKIDPSNWSAYNNIGFTLNKLNKYNEAIDNLKQAIKINKDNAESYYNMGYSYFFLNDYSKAEKNFIRASEIKPSFLNSFFYLGEIYRKQKLIKKALDNFIKSRQSWTTIRILECLLLLNMKDIYYEQIKKLSDVDPENRRTAAATAFFSNQYKTINEFNFCKSPMDYVSIFNILKDIDLSSTSIKKLKKEIKLQDVLWEIPSRTTRNGVTTKENLSLLNLENYKILESIINNKIIEYKKKYINDTSLFVKNWPKKIFYNSWSNTLQKQGFNIAHIHPSGWISGVLYLNIPKKLNNDEGGIEFGLHGYDFIKQHDNIPSKLHIPKIGDLVLFPSSLHHKTIPFNSNEERICIAFDCCKVN